LGINSPAEPVSGPPIVFLDANIIFSAALGGPAFELLLRLANEGGVRLVTGYSCVVEAGRNVQRKRPERQQAFGDILTSLSIEQDEADEHAEWAPQLVNPDDVHVLGAARRVGAQVLITGDLMQFGHLMKRDDLGLRVRTLRAFLLEGPSRP